MHGHAFRATAWLLAAGLAVPIAVAAQSAAQTQTHSGAAVGAQAAQSDSNNGQQAGKTDAMTGKPARSEEAATTGDDFDTLDTDHDGRISRAESGASQEFSGRFKTLDTDGDGYVSTAEYREGLRATQTPTSRP